MKKIILRAYAKINPYLKVLNKRTDGYHNLDLCFQNVSLYDEIIVHKHQNLIIKTEPEIDCSTENNLCYKAFMLLKKDFQKISNLSIYIKKNIPIGAGLGGGSSDAAAILLAMNTMFSLNLSKKRLKEYALLLGSDVPFFLIGGRAIGKGRGEISKKISYKKENHLVLAKPDISISTAWVYQNYVAQKKSLNKTKANDLESIVFFKYPEVKILKQEMLALGLKKPLMSGSGSVVFAYADDEMQAKITSQLLSRKYWAYPCKTINYSLEIF